MSPPPKITRRSLTLGGIAAAGVAIVASAIYEVPHLLKHHARGRYAELVNRLENPEQAAMVGKAVLDSADHGFIDGPSFEDVAFSDLRKRLAKNSIPQLMASDSEDISRMVEAGGWVIPIALAEFAILAAKSV